MDLQLGCGGWWNFDGGLVGYSHRYSFVEVNTTCYRVPSVTTVREWRRIVPDGFEFAVKVPWRPPTERSAILDVLAVLGARYAVVHRSSPWWSEALEMLHDHGYVPVLETRGRRSSEMPALPGWVVKATDPSMPGEGTGSDENETYARVFGAPDGVVHHLGTGMVDRVAGSVRDPLPVGDHVHIVIHSYQMYDDAERVRRAMGGDARG